MSATDTEKALRIVKQLIKAAPSGSVNRFATRMQDRLTRKMTAIPMTQILNEMPGGPRGSIISKAALLGVTRQTVYNWLNGDTRPNEVQAKRLAELTGFSTDVIRGFVDDAP